MPQDILVWAVIVWAAIISIVSLYYVQDLFPKLEEVKFRE